MCSKISAQAVAASIWMAGAALVAADEPVEAPAIYHVGFRFDETGEPTDWNVKSLVVYRHLGVNQTERQEFDEVEEFTRWIGEMKPAQKLRYSVGCVIPSELPVGEQRILISQVRKLCAARGAEFELIGGW